MKRLTIEDPETKTADIISENMAQLKELFPEVITEGRIDFEVLKQLLGDTVDEREEKYGLNWHGKRRARQLALTPSTGTLRPCPEESVDWDTTKNLMIEGDNLEVLKLLQKSYAGKVKLIYIDPPYNTGKDFVYPDDYQDNIKNYLNLTGQTDESGRKITSNTEASGRFHTDWLNMIYPRLKLARNLLREDGVIFITIDSNENMNLKLVCDDIFGPENFVENIVWKKRSSPDARDTIGSIHDSILCYLKNIEKIKKSIGKIPLNENRLCSYSNPDKDPRGDWASVDMTGMTGHATKDQFFSVTLPSGRTIKPPKGRSWGIAEKTYKELLSDGRIWFGKNGNNVPRIKKFLEESDGQVVPSIWDMDDVGSNDEGKKETNLLMKKSGVFDTPKPVRLIKRMIEISCKEEAIILDFFAGSGTTGHSVMEKKIFDNKNLRYILVQLPEPLDLENKDQEVGAAFCDELGRPRNIAELTKERLRRVGKKLCEEHPLFAGDLGFRVFKLASTNIHSWDPDRDNLSQSLLDSIEHIKPDRTEKDILYELLLKLGLDLASPIEERIIAGKVVHSVGVGTLIVCLESDISNSDIERLALGIAEWHKEQAPAGETKVVFRDSAFTDDVAKTNLSAILEQNGLEKVKSL